MKFYGGAAASQVLNNALDKNIYVIQIQIPFYLSVYKYKYICDIFVFYSGTGASQVLNNAPDKNIYVIQIQIQIWYLHFIVGQELHNS